MTASASTLCDRLEACREIARLAQTQHQPCRDEAPERGHESMRDVRDRPNDHRSGITQPRPDSVDELPKA